MIDPASTRSPAATAPEFRIALTGDVILGRGIDQILPHPSPDILYESFAKSALLYISLAEKRNGALPRPVPYSYVWGDLIEDLSIRSPDLCIINLETAITRSGAPAVLKGIHYRMNSANLPMLQAAGIDCCVLANNHVLDWGREGLLETLDVLRAGMVKVAGAGLDDESAEAPAILPVSGKGRVLVYGLACSSSGVPTNWAAGPDHLGVRLLDVRHDSEINRITRQVAQDRQQGDIVAASIHWGPDWGYEVEDTDRAFAHRLIDEAQVDIVHGHSSHHPKGIEFYRDRVILHGCGDLINDYEGIAGKETYRPDLVLLCLLPIASDGTCCGLEMLPYRIARFRLERTADHDTRWLEQRMDQVCAPFGCRVVPDTGPGGTASLRVLASRNDSADHSAAAHARNSSLSGKTAWQ